MVYLCNILNFLIDSFMFILWNVLRTMDNLSVCNSSFTLNGQYEFRLNIWCFIEGI